MIPKIFHRIWFGSAKMPEQHERWWQAWQRQYPSYEFRTWTDADIDALPYVKDKVIEADSFAKKADIARCEILRQHGGIYIDTDFMPLNHFDFAGDGASIITCGPKNNDSFANGFIAMSKGHVAMKIAVDAINATELNKRPILHETGPLFLAKILNKFECKRLPWQALYPYSHNKSFSSVFEFDLTDTIGIHVWHGSWYSPDLQLAKLLSLLVSGDMVELENATKQISMEESASEIIFNLTNDVREVRKRQIACAFSPMLENIVEYGDHAVFDIFKLSLFMFQAQPDAAVWSIGAGDGVFGDRLRSTIINHDPVTVFVEPNPHLFARLQRNYERNENAVFLPGAICPSVSGVLRMTMVNADKVEALQLPKSLFGLSRASSLGLEVDPLFMDPLQSCLDEMDVAVLDLGRVQEAGGGKPPAIVSVDANGMDAEIITAIFSKNLRPKVILTKVSERPEFGELEAFAGSIGYRVIRRGGDALLLENTFMVEYCSHLYIEYGIGSIFEAVLKKVFGHGAKA